MFFQQDKIEQLSRIEEELGANVFKIKESINEDTLINKKVQSLISDKRTSSVEGLEVKDDQIARILSVYSWALKVAGHKEEVVLECLDLAANYADTSEALGLCTYVRSTVFRGYGKFSESADCAEIMLNIYFKNDSPLKAHALNCLALALMRQNKMAKVESLLLEAGAINAAPANTAVEKIITTAEGNFQDRTEGNLAQFYEKTEQFDAALKLAEKALLEKIQHQQSSEEIAYAKIVVGEILLKLNQSDKALNYFNDANAIYSDSSSKMPIANHMRALIGLAETCQKQDDYENCASNLSLAKDIGEQLGFNEAHDFVKRIHSIETELTMNSSLTI